MNTLSYFFSIWYLSFYPNPRLTEVVVSKIMMEGIHATITIYGTFAEKYLYSEEKIKEVCFFVFGVLIFPMNELLLRFQV